jgi:hypothetical protein
MLRFVNAYLARGWALVPLHSIGPNGCTCTRGAERCPSAGKHPIWREWHAPLNLVRDAALWQPQWNIGIATGAPSGHWVLDYDPANDYDGATPGEACSLVQRVNAEIGGPHVETGGGGNHWRFRMPADLEVTNRRGTLPAGLDVRGTGGQVVAPPSVSGKGAYVELTDALPYKPPGWLLDMIRPAVLPPTREPPAGWSPSVSSNGDDRGQRYATAAVRELLTELCNAQTSRNDLAFRAACRIIELTNAGWLGDGRNAADDWEAATCDHPLGIIVPMAEVASLWRSATHRVGDRPAELPPEWTDPLRVEVWPTPPTDAAGVLPFSPSSNGAASMSIPGFSEPGVLSSSSLTHVGSTTTSPSIDPRWEAAVQAEVNRRLIREAADLRLAELRGGDRAALRERLRGELLSAAQLKARPRLRPLVAGLLYRNTLARINGPSGHGKSFIVLDLAARIAAGMAWAGRATTAGPVVYLVAEGDEGVGARVDAWEAHHGREIADVRFLPRPVQAAGPEWPAWCDLLAEIAPALVVVDTQARVTVGADENDAREMGQLVDALDALRVATGACVLLVHHTGRTGTHGRGSTAVTGALQTELGVTRIGRQITMKTGKVKDDAEPDDAVFDLVDVAAPGVEGFSEPGPVAVLGVAPAWRGDVSVAVDGPRESARTTRARALWSVVHRRYNPGMGGTLAEIRQAFADVAWPGPTSGPAGAGFRKAWARAWADLIQLGLVAKSYGAGRFKVVELADQSIDGVLSPNRGKSGELISEGPTGFEIILTDVTESNT